MRIPFLNFDPMHVPIKKDLIDLKVNKKKIIDIPNCVYLKKFEKYKKYYLDINKDFEDIVFYKSDDNGKWIEENFMR